MTKSLPAIENLGANDNRAMSFKGKEGHESYLQESLFSHGWKARFCGDSYPGGSDHHYPSLRKRNTHRFVDYN